MLQDVFTYIDNMSLLQCAGLVLIAIALALFLVSRGLQNSEVDPGWSRIRDGQDRLIGVGKPIGHVEPKTLEGKVLPTRRLH